MSTTANTIKLNGKDYPFRFGMKFQFEFMDQFNIEKISDYQKKIGLLEKMDSKESFKVLGVFIIAAIQAASKKPVDLDVADVLDCVIKDQSIVETMVSAFVQSQPKVEHPNAVGKQKK